MRDARPAAMCGGRHACTGVQDPVCVLILAGLRVAGIVGRFHEQQGHSSGRALFQSTDSVDTMHRACQKAWCMPEGMVRIVCAQNPAACHLLCTLGDAGKHLPFMCDRTTNRVALMSRSCCRAAAGAAMWHPCGWSVARPHSERCAAALQARFADPCQRSASAAPCSRM